MLLAFKLLLFLWALCYFVSALVATAPAQLRADAFLGTVVATSYNSESTPPRLLSMHDSLVRPGARTSSTKLAAAVLPDPYPVAEVDLLRRIYGPARNFWGDLSAQQTRAFYHDLLPVSLLQLEQEAADASAPLTLEERARRASMARHAARLYARERCALPSRITAALYDGFRHLQRYGTWNASGQTWDELWAKYEVQVRAELGPQAGEEAIRDGVCWRILEKSCSTNKMFDRLTGVVVEAEAAAAAEQHRHHKEGEALRAVNVLVRRKVAQAGRRVIRAPLAALSRAPLLRRSNGDMFQRAVRRIA
ncbi:hypothetical protein JKP88DRAFT_224696 [Tribonema minus]|uniref:Uncharacterized protein n=1 Tax=Tribonema minus TaxID=303371 RepID=A0A835YPF0_9STRA|nr:hypothetical protein JKP88DRAFT_224696 [Tribonema minus]